MKDMKDIVEIKMWKLVVTIAIVFFYGYLVAIAIHGMID